MLDSLRAQLLAKLPDLTIGWPKESLPFQYPVSFYLPQYSMNSYHKTSKFYHMVQVIGSSSLVFIQSKYC